MVIAKCEKCGKEYRLESNENPSDFQCECGGELTSNEITSETVKTKNANKTPKDIREDWDKQSKNTPNTYYLQILGILIGVIIIFMVVVGFQKDMYTRFLLGLVGGFIASLIAGGKIKNGAINGTITGILGGVLSAIYIGNFGAATDITGISAWIIGFTLAILIFSLIGGVIGVLCRKILLNNKS